MHAAGIVAGVYPDPSNQTAIVCIENVDSECYEDFRALWREAAMVKRGDFVVFDIMDELEGGYDPDSMNLCISSLNKTNDFVILTKLQKLEML